MHINIYNKTSLFLFVKYNKHIKMLHKLNYAKKIIKKIEKLLRK